MLDLGEKKGIKMAETSRNTGRMDGVNLIEKGGNYGHGVTKECGLGLFQKKSVWVVRINIRVVRIIYMNQRPPSL